MQMMYFLVSFLVEEERAVKRLTRIIRLFAHSVELKGGRFSIAIYIFYKHGIKYM